jgi:sortase (surface protein transpeptidase)
MARRRHVWPVVQLLTLAAVVLTAASFIDSSAARSAADLAADRGSGTSVTLRRAAVRHAAPVQVTIPRLHVKTRLVDLHRRSNGTLQTPKTAELAGWFVGSAHPGDSGPTVIVGHVDSTDGPGVFHDLRRLRAGDVIVVGRADGSAVRFTVQRVERVGKNRFPTAAVYTGRTASLRLVTCGGVFDRRSRHYLDNVIVYAALATAPPRRAPHSLARPRNSR